MNHYSLKKIDELNAEVAVRIQLCARVGGTPVIRYQTVRHNGTKHSIKRVHCVGGVCEHCRKPANFLDPHHKIPRSKGGEFTFENIIMVHRACHRILDGRNPRIHWLK